MYPTCDFQIYLETIGRELMTLDRFLQSSIDNIYRSRSIMHSFKELNCIELIFTKKLLELSRVQLTPTHSNAAKIQPSASRSAATDQAS